MIVHSRIAELVNVNGKWTVVVRGFDDELPSEGRHWMMCNKCGDECPGMSVKE